MNEQIFFGKSLETKTVFYPIEYQREISLERKKKKGERIRKYN